MARSEFPRSVRVAVVKRATKDNVIFCEKCGALAKKFQVDHVIADAHGGKPVIENAMLICHPCFEVKNPQDTTIAAKIKRQEADHLRVKRPAKAKGPTPPKAPRVSKPAVANVGGIFARIRTLTPDEIAAREEQR